MLLALKLVLTPAIIVFSTLTGRRFGRAASGWLIGLPLTSGPITAFFAVQHGRAFAARAAVGSLGGAIAEVAFCIAYAATARRGGWRTAALSGSAAFAVTAALLRGLPLAADESTLYPLAAAAAVALLLGLRLVPPVAARTDAGLRLPSRLDLPARAAVSTVFLLLLTGVATALGPRLSGLLAVYPLYTVVLAAFAHASAGSRGAVQVLRGLLVGLYSFVCFFLVLALALPDRSIVVSFAVATLGALAVQGASLVALRREATA